MKFDGALAEADQHFGCHFSAFLSAAQVLSKAVGWAGIDAVRITWLEDEQTLYRTFTDARDSTVHEGKRGVDSTIQYVPESELHRGPRHPFDGYAIIRRLPGVPEPRRGVRRFTIRIDGRDEPATAACGKYLGLMGRVVKHFDVSPGAATT
jgi:hypothetical protein